jgi:hypothetical protein
VGVTHRWVGVFGRNCFLLFLCFIVSFFLSHHDFEIHMMNNFYFLFSFLYFTVFLTSGQEIPVEYSFSDWKIPSSQRQHVKAEVERKQTPHSNRIELIGLSSSLGVVITGITPADKVGYSVALGGDINGDSKADIIIGGIGYNNDAGVAYALYGGSTLSSVDLSSLIPSQGVAIAGAATGYNTGWSVDNGGDVNGDGYADMIIGAPSYNTNMGMVYIIYGGPTLTSLSSILLANLISSPLGIKIQGTATGFYTGSAVTLRQDMNADGKSDPLIGTYGRNSFVGRSYFIYGASGLADYDLNNSPSDQYLSGAGSGYQSGFSMGSGGDFNGDGSKDTLIGAPGANAGIGKVHVVYGGTSWVISGLGSLQEGQGLTITETNTGCKLGYAVAIGGDVNGDTWSDMLIGAPGCNSNTGKAYLIYGKSFTTSFDVGSLTTTQGIVISGAYANDQVGNSVSVGGDFNGDGKADIVIGAPGYAGNTGAVFLIYGSATLGNIAIQGLTTAQGVKIIGETGNSYTGCSVSLTGDTNNDGKIDLLIGAYGYSSNRGRVYLIYGAASLNTIDLSLTDPTAAPLVKPTSQPTSHPSRQPSSRPTMQPTRQPVAFPTYQPTNRPSGQPSRRPSTQPSSRPTRQPTSNPSSQPTSRPSGQPTRQPSASPATLPSMQPSSQPTSQPSRKPSSQPSSAPTSPTSQPSAQPSRLPTSQPSVAPSRVPSRQPTSSPSGQPSSKPSRQPSEQPSSKPSSVPSRSPSSQPSRKPSGRPSGQPTRQPTSRPNDQPTRLPSTQPSALPSSVPSMQPSSQPTSLPTSIPSLQPFSRPSGQPTDVPSGPPSSQPSSVPSSVPSEQPSSFPSCQPSSFPSSRPSLIPTVQPSALPTLLPSSVPSSQPTTQPSGFPSCFPSTKPTSNPSSQPSGLPTSLPFANPSGFPSTQPTGFPSVLPSSEPSSVPSEQPTSLPSVDPTSQPSGFPTTQPTRLPTSVPSGQPSVLPTSLPSGVPTGFPTRQPSSQPSLLPSSSKSVQPSSQPTGFPTSFPSLQPFSRPSSQPTSQPSECPTGQPTNQPSVRPSSHPTMSPSDQPSSQPTSVPSTQPSSNPSGQPTVQPSTKPSCQPSSHPSVVPSSVPSSQPTDDIYFHITNEQRRLKQFLFLFGTFVIKEGHVFEDVENDEGDLGKSFIVYGNTTNPMSIYLNETENSRDDKYKELNYGQSHDTSFRSFEVVKDINGDDHDDLLLGDPLSSVVYVLYGRGGSDTLYQMGKGYQIIGETTSDYLGWSVSGAGDMNNDRINDIVIGAMLVNKIYIIFGVADANKRDPLLLSSLTQSQGIRITGSPPLSSVGMSLCSVGDFNKDGIGDIAISVRSLSQNFIYIVYGNTTLPSSFNLNTYKGRMTTVVGGIADFAGTTMSGLGDINGDGIDDFIIGSVSRAGLTGTQKSFILYGQRSIVPEIRLDQLTISQGFQVIGGGMGVSGIGDINGDGLNDFMVNSFNNWQGQSASYIMVLPVLPPRPPSMFPTLVPSEVPTLFSNLTSSPSTTKTPSFTPSHSPSTCTPSRTPTTQKPSKAPVVPRTMIPTGQRTAPPIRSPTRSPSFRPSLVINSPSSLPSIYPTYASNSFSSFTDITTGGLHEGNWTDVEVRINSPNNVLLTLPDQSVNKFKIYPQPNMTIVFNNFNSLNLVDLSLFPEFSEMGELSYTSSPFTILLPNHQKIVFSNFDGFELTGRNFIFADQPPSSSGSASSFSLTEHEKSLQWPDDIVMLPIIALVLSVAVYIFLRNSSKQSFDQEEIEKMKQIKKSYPLVQLKEPILSSEHDLESGKPDRITVKRKMSLKRRCKNSPPPEKSSSSGCNSSAKLQTIRKPQENSTRDDEDNGDDEVEEESDSDENYESDYASLPSSVYSEKILARSGYQQDRSSGNNSDSSNSNNSFSSFYSLGKEKNTDSSNSSNGSNPENYNRSNYYSDSDNRKEENSSESSSSSKSESDDDEEDDETSFHFL